MSNSISINYLFLLRTVSKNYMTTVATRDTASGTACTTMNSFHLVEYFPAKIIIIVFTMKVFFSKY